MYEAPIALGGYLTLPDSISVRIKQLQLEQDTAKSTYDPRARQTLVDLNRAGMGLMEIVSEPDMRSPEEAGMYVRALQSLLRTVGASDGNMEQGSLRCDVNVSVNRPGAPLGTRCEIKNLNSVRFMMAAITHEIHRHISILSESPSAAVPQETRGFSENTFETFKLRSKEDAPDYRYMPDMNLGTLLLSEAQINAIRSSMPELPDVTRSRLQEQYNLSPRDTEILLNLDAEKEVPFDGGNGTSVAGAVSYFESICQGHDSAKPRDPRIVINWIIHELLGQLATRREAFTVNRVPPGWLGELIDLVQENVVTRTAGKSLLKEILKNPTAESPKALALRLDLLAFTPSAPGSPTTPSSRASGAGNPDLSKVCEAAISTDVSQMDKRDEEG
ncbi:hypothetical protein ONZ45_g6245 [Pleurotus djamor]|nr:hypothetical protein ONZ45_g6245 [Pleurotus djamor]